MMYTSVNLHKQTSRNESQPRMTSDWKGFKAGQLFQVPLHDNNQQYATVSTGLVQIQPDHCSNETVAWINRYADPDLPPLIYPKHSVCNGVNGCPLSIGAHRTFHIEQPGEYFLETMAGSAFQACDNFNVRHGRA